MDIKDKVAWALLAQSYRTNKKMKELCDNFEKRKKHVDLTGKDALRFMEDLEKADKAGWKFVTYMDEIYPENLRQIAAPPAFLYVRGKAGVLNHPLKVAVVGSRNATAYGMTVAATFGMEFAGEGICVVSGGARGVDTAALEGAIRRGGNVIAVIGTGIDIDYPKENRELFKKIEKFGAVISEFPLGMGPLSENFPRRNRIMTALSESVVIAEAALRSGALISATHALNQGKTLFAVPGNIDSPNSAGTNALLRDGAQFATCAGDVLYELMERVPDKVRSARNYDIDKTIEENGEEDKLVEEAKENFIHLSSFENAVVAAIKSGKDTYDEILEYTSMEASRLTSVLTIMEIKGIIKLALKNRYKLNR